MPISHYLLQAAEPQQSQRSSRRTGATTAGAPFSCEAVITALRAALEQQPQGVPVDLNFGSGKLGRLVAIGPVKGGVELCSVVYDDYKGKGTITPNIPLTKVRLRKPVAAAPAPVTEPMPAAAPMQQAAVAPAEAEAEAEAEVEAEEADAEAAAAEAAAGVGAARPSQRSAALSERRFCPLGVPK